LITTQGKKREKQQNKGNEKKEERVSVKEKLNESFFLD